MSHFLQHTLFKHVYQTKSNDYTKQNKYSMPVFCYGGAQPGSLTTSVNHCVFCLTHSAGKLDFPSLEMGLPNRIISSPIYYHLILEISALAWWSSQTNRQNRADMGYRPLIIYSPADSSCENGALPRFSHQFSPFDLYEGQFSCNESVIREWSLRFWTE